MKSIINEVTDYDIVGFDMDGTLYDEFEFISQAYMEVAKIIACEKKGSPEVVYNLLCNQWLEYGSSENIFQLSTQVLFSENLSYEAIKKCIEAYRLCSFHLTLPQRSIKVLDFLRSQGKEFFLVTDGNGSLQRKKILQLDLEQWFSPDVIAISGDYGRDTQKPSPFMFEKIKLRNRTKGRIVYIGDREIDRQFSENIGASFIKVSVMQQVI